MLMYDISILNLLSEFKIDKRILKKIIKNIFSDHHFEEVSVNLILTDDDEIIRLNKKYLDKDTTTDVLSFMLEINSQRNILEGEVYANLQQIERQANHYNVKFDNELFRIVIHGILHLVGYNDQTKKDRQQMTEKENCYLKLV